MDDHDKQVIADLLVKNIETKTETLLQNHINYGGVFLFLKQNEDCDPKFIDLQLEVVENNKFETIISISLKKDIAEDILDRTSDKIKTELCVGVYTDYNKWEEATNEVGKS